MFKVIASLQSELEASLVYLKPCLKKKKKNKTRHKPKNYTPTIYKYMRNPQHYDKIQQITILHLIFNAEVQVHQKVFK